MADRFGLRYSDEELDEIRERVDDLAEQAAEVRVMYNNNRSSDAPVAAARFRELVGQGSEAAA